jgi:hypothetical protein
MSKSKSRYDWRSVSQSVCRGVEPILGLVTRYYFLSEGCCLVFVWLWLNVNSPSPRSLFVRLTVIPLPLVLMMPLRDPRGRPRFVPRPVGRGLPVTSILLANGRGKAEKKNHKCKADLTWYIGRWTTASRMQRIPEVGRPWAVPRP